ncbi:LCP family protein [Streptomyces sp. TRM70308]|uniref:LCP family protein n=1 Tax=Streptomyces sp. TRM70308 TaxID=3131932 RepID=UPI003D066F9D
MRPVGRDAAHERAAREAQARGWDDSRYDDKPQAARAAPEPGAAPGAGADPAPASPHRHPAPADGSGTGAHPAGGHRTDADGADGGAGPPVRPAPRSRRRRLLRWAALTVSVLILGTSGVGYLYIDGLNDNIRKGELHLGDNKLDSAKPNAAGQTPLNILLLGSDSRNSDANVRLGGSRADRGRPPLADVQMLLHLSADRSSMSVLSIPRDTRVTIPRCTDPEDGTVYQERTGKINTSLQNGGPGCTVATWEELTGVPVDHFVMVDFAGVVAMADAVGGVPVCVDKNVHDPKSGLRLEAGESVVRGEQALQWLRTRHGFEDGSDLGRAKAQHQYMNAMVRQLKAGTKLSNPVKLRNLAEEATKALTVDEGLDSVGKLFGLANQLRQVPTERITMATMPWVYSPGGSYVLPKEGDAEQVFSMLRRDVALDGEDEPPASEPSPAPEPSADPAAIAVRVLNGTGTAAQGPVGGRAAAIAEELRAAGFTQAAAGEEPRSQWDTVLAYGAADDRADARAVAEALGLPDSAVRHSADATGLTLVIGADWRQGATYPESATPSPGAEPPDDNAPPESLDGLHGDDSSACMTVNPAATW